MFYLPAGTACNGDVLRRQKQWFFLAQREQHELACSGPPAVTDFDYTTAYDSVLIMIPRHTSTLLPEDSTLSLLAGPMLEATSIAQKRTENPHPVHPEQTTAEIL